MPIIRFNKSAVFKYDIQEKLEAGIELQGWEVAAIKAGSVELQGSFVKTLGGEVYWINAHVTPLKQQKGKLEADRTRRLLLRRSQIAALTAETLRQGLTIVPLKLYTIRSLIKLEIGLARGKKKYQQSLTKKKQTEERKMKQDAKEAGIR